MTRKTKTSTQVKSRWNKAHYAEIHVRLDKELVAEFKAKLKENGDTQAEIIRQVVNDYLSKNE